MQRNTDNNNSIVCKDFGEMSWKTEYIIIFNFNSSFLSETFSKIIWIFINMKNFLDL